MKWVKKSVEVVNNEYPIRTVNALAPDENKCPKCKFKGVKPKGAPIWEKWYYVENIGQAIKEREKERTSFIDDLVFTCRKCEYRFRVDLYEDTSSSSTI
tara:strand:+ start:93 stop:389 length:297 start_codon:yes stop_codon:yes gene_type:complete